MSWVPIANLADFAEHKVIGVTHGSLQLALYLLPDGVYATSNACPHQHARLSEGEVVEGLIECPAHYALYDIKTGRCEGGPTDGPLATYRTRVEDGCVFVFLSNDSGDRAT